MSASTHPAPAQPARGGVEMRLPWWAVALPVLAFVALLLLVASPTDAHAAGHAWGVEHLLGLVWRILTS